MAFSQTFKPQLGLTLLELLVVLAIASVLAGIAVPSFQQQIATSRLKSASSQLYLATIRARSEAVKRNTSISITPTSGDWINGWRIETGDGATIAIQAPLKGVAFRRAPASVIFLISGRTRAGITPPSFQIEAAYDSEIVRCLTIDASGRPYVRASTC